MITTNQNRIKEQFGEIFRKYASVDYQRNTTPRRKLEDKKELDNKIKEARDPLSSINKLTLGELSSDVQSLTMVTTLSKLKTNILKYNNKEILAHSKLALLLHYRNLPQGERDGFLVRKFALEELTATMVKRYIKD